MRDIHEILREYWGYETFRPLQEEYRGRIDIRIGVELGMQPNAMTKRLLRLRESLRAYLENEGVGV